MSYFSGSGGFTPPGGNIGSPSSVAPGGAPDLRKDANRASAAILVKFCSQAKVMHIWVAVLVIAAVIIVSFISFVIGFRIGKAAGESASTRTWSMRVDQLTTTVSDLRARVDQLKNR